MEKIIFVYQKNKDEFINGIFDFFHKLMMPDTYNCDPCEVTHNYSGMRSAWKSYLEWLPLPTDYYNKQQFLDSFPNENIVSFPCVFVLHIDGKMELVISSEKLKNVGLDELTTLINKQVVSCRIN